MNGSEDVGAQLGFIGLGAMGSRIAARLLANGYPVVAYDIRPEAVASLVGQGAKACGSPAEVASRATTVLVSLPTPDIVRRVVSGSDGLIHGTAIRYYVDLSTTGPTVAAEIADVLAEYDIAGVDAPVSGGVQGAEAGTLAVMVAGEGGAIEKVRPALECFGKSVFVVGDKVGQGQVAKIVNNLLSATAIVVTSEAVALGLRAGIDASTLLAILNAGSGRNSATEDKFPRAVLSGTMTIDFQLGLMAKDLRLCLAEAHRLRAPMFVGGVIEQLWSLADYTSPDHADSMEIVRMISTWMGIDIAEARV